MNDVMDSMVRATYTLTGKALTETLTREDVLEASGSEQVADMVMAHLAESAAKNVMMEIR